MSTTKWALDPDHSELSFKVRHLMISNVKGSFKNFTAEIDADGNNFSNAQVTASVDVNSINTNNEDRDNHLKSADFFNAAIHPAIDFTSTSFEEELIGDLTINGVTKKITLDVEFGGIATDSYGNERAGFSFEGKVKRRDFNLTYNAVLETGGAVVGDEVKIYGDVEFVKQS